MVHAEIKYLKLWSYLISLRGSLSFLSEISLERRTAEAFQRTLEVMCSSKVENREPNFLFPAVEFDFTILYILKDFDHEV